MEGVERTMRDRMLAGEPYVFDESLEEDTRRCRDLLHRINTATPDQDDVRDAWLRDLLNRANRRHIILDDCAVTIELSKIVIQRIARDYDDK